MVFSGSSCYFRQAVSRACLVFERTLVGSIFRWGAAVVGEGRAAWLPLINSASRRAQHVQSAFPLADCIATCEMKLVSSCTYSSNCHRNSHDDSACLSQQDEPITARCAHARPVRRPESIIVSMCQTQLSAPQQSQKNGVLELNLSTRIDVGPAHLGCANQRRWSVRLALATEHCVLYKYLMWIKLRNAWRIQECSPEIQRPFNNCCSSCFRNSL